MAEMESLETRKARLKTPTMLCLKCHRPIPGGDKFYFFNPGYFGKITCLKCQEKRKEHLKKYYLEALDKLSKSESMAEIVKWRNQVQHFARELAIILSAPCFDNAEEF
jgi:hypothetical protein